LNKSKITFNAISAIIQVVIVGTVYFILYKFILTQLGIELLGVWSLIVASTSVVSVANFGISSSIVKFVSTYIARKRTDLINKLVFTSLIFILSTYTLLSIIVYFLGTRLLHFIIDEHFISIAITLLPFSLISLIINATSGVFNSAIDGIQKNYIKSYIIIFSSIVLLVLSILLTPKFGILGLVYAQIGQAIFVLTLTYIFFIKLFHIPLNIRWNWDSMIFKEIFNYGFKIQIASILEMTLEPISKFLLSKFGGLIMVGYYEMAARLLVQLRSLITSATQVIIPVVAEAKEINPNYITILYTKSFSIVLYLNILLTTFIVVSAPVISLLWIGHYESIFVNVLILGSLSMFFNISSTPSYFNYMGEGKINWIIISIIISFSTNIIIGYFLGLKFGGFGVVIASSIALILNALLIISSFHKFKEIKIFSLLSYGDLKLIITAIIFMIFSNQVFHSIFNLKITSAQIFLYTLCLFLFVFYVIKNHTFMILRTLILKLINGIKGLNV
jgi:O-antigen/teichoic acid export membrane protein